MSYFEENRKFLSLNGVLGRRDFIINCLIIKIVELLICSTPLLYMILINPNLAGNFTSVNSLPQWYIIWVCVVGLISSVLYFSSIIRRVRDILGAEDDNKINAISGVLTVLNFCSYLPVGFLGRLIGFAILVYLAATSGAITGAKPKSEIIKFNWGAFFGTWLWGLFNRSPITLLMLPLFFTSAGLPFMILCGMKGNEWAYNNKKYESVESFHESQSKQTIVWIIIVPVLNFLLAFGSVYFSMLGTYKYVKQNPEAKTKLINMFNYYQTTVTEANFDKIEGKDGVYKFYLEPEVWKELPDSLKVSQFKNAMVYSLIKNGKTFLDGSDFIDFVDVLNDVKIYSTFNNEILAQYYMEPAKAKEIKAKFTDKKMTSAELQREFRKGYKFNNNPSTP